MNIRLTAKRHTSSEVYEENFSRKATAVFAQDLYERYLKMVEQEKILEANNVSSNQRNWQIVQLHELIVESEKEFTANFPDKVFDPAVSLLRIFENGVVIKASPADIHLHDIITADSFSVHENNIVGTQIKEKKLEIAIRGLIQVLYNDVHLFRMQFVVVKRIWKNSELILQLEACTSQQSLKNFLRGLKKGEFIIS